MFKKKVYINLIKIFSNNLSFSYFNIYRYNKEKLSFINIFNYYIYLVFILLKEVFIKEVYNYKIVNFFNNYSKVI